MLFGHFKDMTCLTNDDIILPGDIIDFDNNPALVIELDLIYNRFQVYTKGLDSTYFSISCSNKFKKIRRSKFANSYKIFPKICEENLCPIRSLVGECDPQCKYFGGIQNPLFNKENITIVSLSFRILDSDSYFQFYLNKYGHSNYEYYVNSRYILGGKNTKKFILELDRLDIEDYNYGCYDYDLEVEEINKNKRILTIEQTAIETKSQTLSQINYLCDVCFINNCKNCKLNDLRRNLQKI